MENINGPENRALSVKRSLSCDVLVVGGGVAGVSAALAAARHGRHVILCESSGVLGGQATLGAVTPLSSHKDRNDVSFGGIAEELVEGLIGLSKQYAVPEVGATWDTVSFLASTHSLKYLLLKLLDEAGVKVMFHTVLADAEAADGRVRSAYLLEKGGLVKVEAEQFIDASGDADLCVLCREKTVLGSEKGVYDELVGTGLDDVHEENDKSVVRSYTSEEGLMQPVSIFFVLGGVDYKTAASYNNKPLTYEDLGIPQEEFRRLPYFGKVGFEENAEHKDLVPLPQGRILVTHGIRPDYAVINMSRVNGINGADAESLSKGEVEAQLQIFAILDLLKRCVRGFENCYLVSSADTLGVRETRRVVGKTVLSGLDVIECRRFPDAIARGSYMIDIHDPKGQRKALGGFIKGAFYEIPYGSICPAVNENLFVCGRCISCDHVAHSSTRIQGTCILTGQAAGTAAALSVGKSDRCDAETLRTALMADGVRL